MVEKFHNELEELKKDVIKMGDLSKKMLKESIVALKDLDEKKAKWVIDHKNDIADLDDDIEDRTLRLITLYQPMAKDMREIACILKLITYLTRIGRYGKDIANIVKHFEKDKHVRKLVDIPHMADLVCSMIEDAMKVFKTGDIKLFNDFIDREEDVDELRYSIFREALSYMMEDPKVIKRCMDYTMVARYLERCADHACKMAEKIFYMETGHRVEIDCRDETSKACFTGVKNNGHG